MVTVLKSFVNYFTHTQCILFSYLLLAAIKTWCHGGALTSNVVRRAVKERSLMTGWSYSDYIYCRSGITSTGVLLHQNAKKHS